MVTEDRSSGKTIFPRIIDRSCVFQPALQFLFVKLQVIAKGVKRRILVAQLCIHIAQQNKRILWQQRYFPLSPFCGLFYHLPAHRASVIAVR